MTVSEERTTTRPAPMSRRGGTHRRPNARPAQPAEPSFEAPQLVPSTDAIPDLVEVSKPENLPRSGSYFDLEAPKAPGTIGLKSVLCQTNFFKMKLNFPAVYFYTVTIKEMPGSQPQKRQTGPKFQKKPGPLSLKTCRGVFIAACANELKDYRFAFNGRDRAVSLQRYKNDALNFKIEFKRKLYHMTFVYEKSVSTNCLKPGPEYAHSQEIEEVMMGVTLLLKKFPSQVFTTLGQGFYGYKEPIPLGEGVHMWQGFKMRVALGTDEMFFNIDYSVAAFIQPGSMVRLVEAMFGQRQSLAPRDVYKLQEKVFHCKAETTHSENRKQFTIAGISKRSASEETFSVDGRRVTVAAYFTQKYGRLQFPKLPCVVVAGGRSLLPLEAVDILPGNPHPKDLPPRVEKVFIKNAAIKPSERFRNVFDAVRTVQQEYEQEFGMVIQDQLKTQARLLPVPKLDGGLSKQGQRQKMDVQPGVIRVKNEQFYTPSTIGKWTVINTDNRLNASSVVAFVNKFMRSAVEKGIEIGEPLRTRNEYPYIDGEMSSDKFEQCVRTLVKEHNLEYVMFMISDFTRQHAAIKALCDYELCIRSKCVKSSTVGKVVDDKRPGINQIILNILYGLNPKFEGENVVGASTEFAAKMLRKEAILVIGIDVNHGTARSRPGMALCPSTVGVVGSRNLNATLYTAFGMAQKKPKNSADREIVQNHILETAVTAIAKEFESNTGLKPKRVIVLRDGVSDGQFNAVLDKEFRSIANAFGKLGYRPNITLASVQKRHLTRIIPAVPERGPKGPLENPTPGTVIDTVMTSPLVNNFYLITHETIQGTCKPPHYTILKDENKLSNDQLQNFVNYLCYLYGKCPRAVSIPTPTYYAHHMAKRASEVGAYRWSYHPQCYTPLRDVERQEELMLQDFEKNLRVKDPRFMNTMCFL